MSIEVAWGCFDTESVCGDEPNQRPVQPLTVIAPSEDFPVKVLGVPGTAGADAEPGVGAVEEDPLVAVAAGGAAVEEPPAEDPLDAVAAGDAAVDEAPEMRDDASDGEMVRVLVL
jgi:hypothetical protein